MATQGRAIATRRTIRWKALILPLRTKGPMSTRPATRSGRTRPRVLQLRRPLSSDDDSRSAELLDQAHNVTCGLRISVGGKRRNAVAIPPEVGTCQLVAVRPKARSQESIGASEIAHAEDEDNKRSRAANVVADLPARTGQELRTLGWRRCGRVHHFGSFRSASGGPDSTGEAKPGWRETTDRSREPNCKVLQIQRLRRTGALGPWSLIPLILGYYS